MHQLTIIHPTTGKAYPLADISADSFYIDHVYGGLDTLSFDISPQHPLYPLCGYYITPSPKVNIIFMQGRFADLLKTIPQTNRSFGTV